VGSAGLKRGSPSPREIQTAAGTVAPSPVSNEWRPGSLGKAEPDPLEPGALSCSRATRLLPDTIRYPVQGNFSNLTSGVLAVAAPRHRGATTGLYSCVGFGGGFFGTLLFGITLDQFGGTSQFGAWILSFGTCGLACLAHNFWPAPPLRFSCPEMSGNDDPRHSGWRLALAGRGSQSLQRASCAETAQKEQAR
jgi:hypothetical protein